MTTQNLRSFNRRAPWILGLIMAALVAPAASASEITIQFSPNTLNLQSNGKVVTIHTDVPYSAVDVYTVYLLDVPIQSWKASSRGYFVAKFRMDDVKAIDGLELNEYNEFKFVGLTKSGEPVWGTVDVMVADRGWRPSGRDAESVDE